MAWSSNKSRGSFSSNSSSPRRYGGGSYSGARPNRFGGNRGRSYGGGGFRGRRGPAKTEIMDKSIYVNNITAVDDTAPVYQGVSYSEYKLDDRLAKNLTHKGFATTTQIQEKVIPLVMDGKNVLGISATGSGKTGAFLIPMIQKLLKDATQKILIVAPTRELALQIAKEAQSFTRGTFLQTTAIIGGESMGRQISQLKRGGDIVVGTPGRLKDLMERRILDLSKYNNVVIDEVDRMFDMGFIDEIRYMFTQLPQQKHSLFFSATLNNKVEGIVRQVSGDFELVKLEGNKPSKNVVQTVVDYTHADQKITLLQEILVQEDSAKVLIFVETKRYADLIDKALYHSKHKVGVIHGDKRQNVRKRVVESFKSSRINILVATNVAARGLDIDDITHVINLDEPQNVDEYIHRIGRTGRNGAFGKAITFVKR